MQLQPLIASMSFMEGKESWKVRQSAIEAVTTLMTKHPVVVANRAVGSAMTVLKDRLSESNLNLRARVLVCIGAIAKSVGREVTQWNALLFPELMKLCSETKQNVLDAL